MKNYCLFHERVSWFTHDNHSLPEFDSENNVSLSRLFRQENIFTKDFYLHSWMSCSWITHHCLYILSWMLLVSFQPLKSHDNWLTLQIDMITWPSKLTWLLETSLYMNVNLHSSLLLHSTSCWSFLRTYSIDDWILKNIFLWDDQFTDQASDMFLKDLFWNPRQPCNSTFYCREKVYKVFCQETKLRTCPWKELPF